MKRILFRLAAAGIGCALALAGVEFALRAVDGARSAIPRYIACDCPYLYAPNPARDDISSQGLRDRVFEIPKPARTTRVLVLGDSVAYADEVSFADGFVKLLERDLRERFDNVEVVNASAEGYTPYNEWMFYRHAGRRFEPDIVITQLCLNDIANPRLHWEWARELGILDSIPDEAIPNPEYDVRIQAARPAIDVAPATGSKPLLRGLPGSLHLYRLLRGAVTGRSVEASGSIAPQVSVGELPVYITGEDTLPITAWLDDPSPEWDWLRSMLDGISADVRADGARHLLLIAPLRYQLDPAYPYRPQERLAQYCTESGLRCIDPLEALQRDGGPDLYVGESDAWHFGKRGHRIVAEEIAKAVAPLIPSSSR